MPELSVFIDLPKCTGEAKVIASIEDQAIIDKFLQLLQAKGILLQLPELLPTTRAYLIRASCDRVQQHEGLLPGGLLPELSQKTRKAVEEGGFSLNSRVLC